MKLTRAQRRKAAQHARKLAYEIVEGEAPTMYRGSWSTCACGVVAARANLPCGDLPDVLPAGRILEDTAFDPFDITYGLLVSNGLIERGPDGAVFPLLYMADCLERL